MKRSFFAIAFLSLFFYSLIFGDPPSPDFTLFIPMRDGVELPADIYLPSFTHEKSPCILFRSPAGRKGFKEEYAEFLKAGYAIVVQDTRSILDLRRETIPYVSDGWGEQKDGYDTVEWLAHSSFTNGNIGTKGASALGITQLMMAPSAPPSLKCQYIEVAAPSMYHHGIFRGGTLLKNQVEGWLGLYSGESVLRFVSDQPVYNDFWKSINTIPVASEVTAPAIHYGGWYDIFSQGTIDSFVSRQESGSSGAHGNQKLVMGPWSHLWLKHRETKNYSFGDFQIPEEARSVPFDISPLRWFDHYLKGIPNNAEKLPPIIYYVMGPFDGSSSKGNRWKTANSWPIPAQQVSLYLTEEKKLSKDNEPEASIFSYLHNPASPVPTLGGANLFLESGPKDQQSIEQRPDVVTFTTEPLEEDLEVTGRVLAKIFFSTESRDADIAVRLTDVYPDGRSILITDGISRLGVVHGINSINSARPFIRPREVMIDLWSTSMVFAKGHRIRVSISSSSYPRFEINPSTDSKIGDEEIPVAKNSIHTGSEYPSRIILPVVKN